MMGYCMLFRFSCPPWTLGDGWKAAIPQSRTAQVF